MPEHQQTHQSTESKTTFQKQATPRIQTLISHPMAIIQRAKINPKSLTHDDVMQLQRTIGNRAVGRLLSEIGLIPSKAKQAPPVQMQTIPEEEKEPLQGKITEPIQRQEIPEEEEPLQTKRENNTGMPDNLKAGVESLSGIDMSDVRVHYNSSKPAEVGALAYTQGTNIHVAPGQENHLPHEAWHVVQQAKGRVQATTQMKGLGINDDPTLEQEADMMGAKTAQFVPSPDKNILQGKFGERVAQKVEKAPSMTVRTREEQERQKASHVYVTQCVGRAEDQQLYDAYRTNYQDFQLAAAWAIHQPEESRKFYLGPRNITFEIHNRGRGGRQNMGPQIGYIGNRTAYNPNWSPSANDAMIEGLSCANTRFRIASSEGQSIFDFLTQNHINNSRDLFWVLNEKLRQRQCPNWALRPNTREISVTMREIGILLDQGYTPHIDPNRKPGKERKGQKLTFMPPAPH